jgi:predicted nucleic-acid-binding protein
MQALDSNVLIRYLVRDHPAQSRQAAQIIERAQQNQERLFLSLFVLCETFWVLDYTYKQTRSAIADVIDEILETPVFEVEHAALMRACILSYRTGRAGLADYVIGAVAERAGCAATVTFDRDLRRCPGFRVL